MLDNAKDNGYQVVTSASELDGIAEANADKPVLGLFSEGNMPRVLNQSIPTTDGGDLQPAQGTVIGLERPAQHRAAGR